MCEYVFACRAQTFITFLPVPCSDISSVFCFFLSLLPLSTLRITCNLHIIIPWHNQKKQKPFVFKTKEFTWVLILNCYNICICISFLHAEYQKKNVLMFPNMKSCGPCVCPNSAVISNNLSHRTHTHVTAELKSKSYSFMTLSLMKPVLLLH